MAGQVIGDSGAVLRRRIAPRQRIVAEAVPAGDSRVMMMADSAFAALASEGSSAAAAPSDTVTLPPAQWRVLDSAHAKRNRAEYEGDVDVDEALVVAVIRIGREIEIRIKLLPFPTV